MEQEAWLRMWREEIPASNESTTSFSLTRLYGDVEEIRQKLHLNNIFTIAQRTIDGMSTFFTAVKLVNGARLLSELKIGSDRTSAFLATKSISLDFVGAFETAFSQVLNSRPS
ncbi:Coatomer/calthrin adaptor appendage, C-terminal subdomain-containing protein [Zopfochytrium polystomum]|nr:Coatomer/calthrin adaptor appendage, C-terminal subdomain-containing protein [Zopfochytrium polystomum]